MIQTCIKCSQCSQNVHTHRNSKNTKHWRLSRSRYEIFFWRHFFMLTVRPSSALNSLTQPTRVRTPQSTNSLASPRSEKSTRFVKVQISTPCFNSKSLRIPAHCFRAWRYSHPLSNFLSGVFIVTSVIVTSSPRAREHLHSVCAPN